MSQLGYQDEDKSDSLTGVHGGSLLLNSTRPFLIQARSLGILSGANISSTIQNYGLYQELLQQYYTSIPLAQLCMT